MGGSFVNMCKGFVVISIQRCRFSREEIEQYGLNFNESRFTTPHINRQFLSELFEENTEEVIGALFGTILLPALCVKTVL